MLCGPWVGRMALGRDDSMLTTMVSLQAPFQFLTNETNNIRCDDKTSTYPAEGGGGGGTHHTYICYKRATSQSN